MITPVTRRPYQSGTPITDSSITSVPGTRPANSQFAASPMSNDSPLPATRPVIPTPTLVRRTSITDGTSVAKLPRKAIGTTSSPSTTKTRQLW